jgi:RNA polymerase sigma-70 factor (ECF subfamily)
VNDSDADFAELYVSLVPRLRSFLRRQTRNSAHADDLLQETMLRIHRVRGRFTPGADVVPWAFAIARRILIDSIRSERRHILRSLRMQPSDGAPLLADMFELRESARVLRQALTRLPCAQREAIELVAGEGLTLREAAAEQRASVSTVKVRVHRARGALRQAFRRRGYRAV